MPNQPPPASAENNRVLVKLRPSNALRAAESRVNLQPLYDPPPAGLAPTAGGFGFDATPQWFVADIPDLPAAAAGTPWDFAHAQVAAQLGVAESDVVYRRARPRPLRLPGPRRAGARPALRGGRGLRRDPAGRRERQGARPEYLRLAPGRRLHPARRGARRRRVPRPPDAHRAPRHRLLPRPRDRAGARPHGARAQLRRGRRELPTAPRDPGTSSGLGGNSDSWHRHAQHPRRRRRLGLRRRGARRRARRRHPAAAHCRWRRAAAHQLARPGARLRRRAAAATSSP